MIEHTLPPAPTTTTSTTASEASSPPPKNIPPKNSLHWIEERFNTARGEQALWGAVITQALQDALSKCKKTESRFYKHEAINWLIGSSKDFVEVCLCAGFDPDYVRRKAKQVLAAPTAWRAEAGQGKRYLERKAYREKMKNREEEKPQENMVIEGPWGQS